MSIANPHFDIDKIERAPYELARLLQDLPPKHEAARLTKDQRLMVGAAADHAANYNTAVLAGIDAIGQLLFAAATNDKGPLESRVAADVGALLSALAVQAQFLGEFTAAADSTLARQGDAA